VHKPYSEIGKPSGSRRVVDVRTFDDILETFGGRSSHIWCDFFARLSDGDVTANTSLEKLRSNVRLALCFLYDVGTILTRLRGAHALPPFWHTAIAAYNHVLEKQYDSVTIDARAANVVGKQSECASAVTASIRVLICRRQSAREHVTYRMHRLPAVRRPLTPQALQSAFDDPSR
jgi:hypothetical protein